MGKIELKKNDKIRFIEDGHLYVNAETGEQLSGLTSVLERQLFPDLFSQIPEITLKKASEYGQSIHQACYNFDTKWIHDGSVVLQDYINICNSQGLEHEESEWLVTNGSTHASLIDKIYRTGDKTVSIADLKSYGNFSPERYLLARFQLSFYAMWLEEANVDLSVDHLYVIRLRNKERKDGTFDHVAEIVEMKRIPKETCKELLEADLRGEQFINPYDIPPEIRQKENLIQSLLTVKKSCEEKLAVIKADVLEKMASVGVKAWEGNCIRFTRKAESTRTSFDWKAYQKDNPDLDLSKYFRESIVAESLQISA